MFNSLLNNSVPNLWMKDGIGYPCLKPLNSWFEDRVWAVARLPGGQCVFAHFAQDMILRFDFFRDWIEGGIPVAYWISSFYFPQASPASLRPSQSKLHCCRAS